MEHLLPTVAEKGRWLREQLQARGLTVRGRGMLLGVEVPHSLAVSRSLLKQGYIALPAGEAAEVLALTPPLVITQAQLQGFLSALDVALS